MLNIGDRVWLSSGYDMKPAWLEDGDGYLATVLSFKQFDFGTQVIARLDKKNKSNKLESDVIFMQLRHKNAVWDDKEHVHIFLCSEIPFEEFVSKEWLLHNTIWIESHANYKKV